MLTPIYCQYKKINSVHQQLSVNTKQLHRDKTLINLLHMGILLMPKWLQSIDKKIDINLNDPYFIHCSPLDFVTYFTYIFAIPVTSVDLYQRQKRVHLLKLISSQQKELLHVINRMTLTSYQQPEYLGHLLAISTQTHLALNKTTLDLQRHKLQNFTNASKLITALGTLSMQALKNAGVLTSLKLTTLGSVAITAPFLFCGFVFIASFIDFTFALKKLTLALKQKKAAQETLVTLMSIPSTLILSTNQSSCAYLALSKQNLEKSKNRVKKRQAKLIMRTTVVMTAITILLPSFGVPFLFAALAGTLTFSVYCIYYLYQRHNHQKKTSPTASHRVPQPA